MLQEESISKDYYRTLSREGRGIYKEKGSKFLGYAFSVETVEETQLKLNELRTKYHDARHHCFAYRLNPEKPEFRVNDDGEPSNSAGMPIYNQMQSADLWNTMIVVVRYFGGTKLGVSGLINAYKEAAKEAVENAVIFKKYITETLNIRFPYENMNDVMRLVKDNEADLVQEKMGQDAGYLLAIRKSRYKPFIQKLKQIHQVEIQ